MTSYCADADCRRPVQSTTLCGDHAAELAVLLHQSGWVIDQLRVALTRQQRFVTGGSGSGEVPIAYNIVASDVTIEYATTICRWQAKVADHLGTPVRYPNPIAASLWIDAHLDRLHGFIDAGKMLNDIDSAHQAALRTINKPADKWFAGTCGAVRPDDSSCPRDLYADTSAGVITCALCGAHHEIAERRALLLEYAMDHLATATEIARAVVVWSDYARGENRLVKRIGMWEARGRILPRGTTAVHGRPRPTYRLGDILDLLAEDAPESSPRAG